MSKALFLDRDGTLIVDRHYLSDPDGVELLPGVKAALHSAVSKGFRLFLFTNQSGVARGYYTLADIHACNARLLQLLDLPSPGFTGICNAIEAPETTSGYRKPSPRYILEMLAAHALDPLQTWMVGDKFSDVEAGLAAGVHAVLLANPPPTKLPGNTVCYSDFFTFYQNHFTPIA